MISKLTFTVQSVDMSIPLTCYDLKYWDYLCGKKAENEVLKALKTKNKKGEEIDAKLTPEQTNSLKISAMIAFCDYVLNLPDGTSSGDIIPFHSTNDLDPRMSVYDIAISASVNVSTLSLMKIYYHINNMVENFDGASFTDAKMGDKLSFFHRGEKYVIGSQDIENNPSGLTANEFIANSEIRQIGKPVFNEATDISEHAMTMYTQLAILARKEGEQLETNPLTRQRFIERRALYFKEGISFAIVKEVDFFLSSLAINYLTSKGLNTSTKARRKYEATATQATMSVV